MNKPPSEQPAKGRRPPRRALSEFALPGESASVDRSASVSVLIPIEPAMARPREEDASKAPAKIRRVRIAPELLNEVQQTALELPRAAAEVNIPNLRALEIAGVAAIAPVGSQSEAHKERRDTFVESANANTLTSTSAFAEYNERTLKLIFDAAATTFELTQGLMKARGPVEVASLATNHLRILSALVTEHTIGLGSIARRLTAKP